MPEGTKVVSAETYGNSAWTITGRVQVVLPDGNSKAYFLKVSVFSFSFSSRIIQQPVSLKAVIIPTGVWVEAIETSELT